MEFIPIIGLLFLNVALVIATLLFIFWLVESILLSAPFLPLPKKVVKHVANTVYLEDGGQFYDLGSGDGRVVRAVARKYPRTQCTGVEKALLPSILAWIYSKSHLRANTHFLKQDYNDIPLEKADAVFLYLWPEAMTSILTKLKQELSPKAKVICCRFPLPNIKAVNVRLITDKKQDYNLYIYHAEDLKDNLS